MEYTLLILLSLNVGIASGSFVCYCSINHAAYPLRECPLQESRYIGFIYESDPHPDNHDAEITLPFCFAKLNINVPDGWVAVFYDITKEIGYFRMDSGFEERFCHGNLNVQVAFRKTSKCTHQPTGSTIGLVFNPLLPTTRFSASKLTTKTATITTAATTTTVNTPSTMTPNTKTSRKSNWIAITKATTMNFIWITPPNARLDCVGTNVDTDVMNMISVYNPKSKKCSNPSISHDEAVLMSYCNAPAISRWIPGIKVIDNCSSIPKYTPVSFFTSNAVQDGSGSGIFTECTAMGFKIARQTCINQFLEIVELPPPVASGYYTVTW